MAVPNTSTFSFQDVKNEFSKSGLTVTSLTDAFSKAISSGFDNNYKGNLSTLYHFRNYNHVVTTLNRLVMQASNESTPGPGSIYTSNGIIINGFTTSNAVTLEFTMNTSVNPSNISLVRLDPYGSTVLVHKFTPGEVGYPKRFTFTEGYLLGLKLDPISTSYWDISNEFTFVEVKMISSSPDLRAENTEYLTLSGVNSIGPSLGGGDILPNGPSRLGGTIGLNSIPN